MSESERHLSLISQSRWQTRRELQSSYLIALPAGETQIEKFHDSEKQVSRSNIQGLEIDKEVSISDIIRSVRLRHGYSRVSRTRQISSINIPSVQENSNRLKKLPGCDDQEKLFPYSGMLDLSDAVIPRAVNRANSHDHVPEISIFCNSPHSPDGDVILKNNGAKSQAIPHINSCNSQRARVRYYGSIRLQRHDIQIPHVNSKSSFNAASKVGSGYESNITLFILSVISFGFHFAIFSASYPLLSPSPKLAHQEALKYQGRKRSSKAEFELKASQSTQNCAKSYSRTDRLLFDADTKLEVSVDEDTKLEKQSSTRKLHHSRSSKTTSMKFVCDDSKTSKKINVSLNSLSTLHDKSTENFHPENLHQLGLYRIIKLTRQPRGIFERATLSRNSDFTQSSSKFSDIPISLGPIERGSGSQKPRNLHRSSMNLNLAKSLFMKSKYSSSTQRKSEFEVSVLSNVLKTPKESIEPDLVKVYYKKESVLKILRYLIKEADSLLGMKDPDNEVGELRLAKSFIGRESEPLYLQGPRDPNGWKQQQSVVKTIGGKTNPERHETKQKHYESETEGNPSSMRARRYQGRLRSSSIYKEHVETLVDSSYFLCFPEKDNDSRTDSGRRIPRSWNSKMSSPGLAQTNLLNVETNMAGHAKIFETGGHSDACSIDETPQISFQAITPSIAKKNLYQASMKMCLDMAISSPQLLTTKTDEIEARATSCEDCRSLNRLLCVGQIHDIYDSCSDITSMVPKGTDIRINYLTQEHEDWKVEGKPYSSPLATLKQSCMKLSTMKSAPVSDGILNGSKYSSKTFGCLHQLDPVNNGKTSPSAPEPENPRPNEPSQINVREISTARKQKLGTDSSQIIDLKYPKLHFHKSAFDVSSSTLKTQKLKDQPLQALADSLSSQNSTGFYSASLPFSPRRAPRLINTADEFSSDSGTEHCGSDYACGLPKSILLTPRFRISKPGEAKKVRFSISHESPVLRPSQLLEEPLKLLTCDKKLNLKFRASLGVEVKKQDTVKNTEALGLKSQNPLNCDHFKGVHMHPMGSALKNDAFMNDKLSESLICISTLCRNGDLLHTCFQHTIGNVKSITDTISGTYDTNVYNI